ncbi:porin [Brevibacterium sp. GP-SGM9]|uniref:porin n=1 Tax=Brevibacterium sp. GP-SGM9 TaxID=3376990 RepID=UPI0039A57D7C
MSAAPVVEQLSREMGISTAAALFDGIPPHPVDSVLSPMFRRGGLPRGELVTFTGGQSLSCALATIAAATKERKWCAGIGLGEPAVASIADLGVDLDHFVNLATPSEDWLRVVSILIESFDILLVDPGFLPSASERARLLAKIRERRISLISLRPMSGSTEQIEITDTQWSGTSHGHGRLRSCLVRARSQTGIHRFLLPGPTGTPAEAPSVTQAPAVTPAPVVTPVHMTADAGAPEPVPAGTSAHVPAGASVGVPAGASAGVPAGTRTGTHLRQVIGGVG